jgi:hypothetical protein
MVFQKGRWGVHTAALGFFFGNEGFAIFEEAFDGRVVPLWGWDFEGPFSISPFLGLVLRKSTFPLRSCIANHIQEMKVEM